MQAELEVKAFKNGQDGEFLHKLMDLMIGHDLGELSVAFGMRVIGPFAVDTFGFEVSVVYVFSYFFNETGGDEKDIFGVDFGESVEKGGGVSDLLGVEPGLIEHGVGLDLLQDDRSNVLTTVGVGLIHFINGVFEDFLEVF